MLLLIMVYQIQSTPKVTYTHGADLAVRYFGVYVILGVNPREFAIVGVNFSVRYIGLYVTSGNKHFPKISGSDKNELNISRNFREVIRMTYHFPKKFLWVPTMFKIGQKRYITHVLLKINSTTRLSNK